MWKRSLFFVAILASFSVGVCGAQRLLAYGPGLNHYCVSGAATTCPLGGTCSYRLGTCTTWTGVGGTNPGTPDKCSHCTVNTGFWLPSCCLNNNSCGGWNLVMGVACSCDADDLPPNGVVYFCQRPPSVWTLFASR
jgi:hypothetical protein